ncbi:MAG: single-stranded-DNA-specific exonuclease RecJ [Caldimicrobium sp.]
MEKERLWIQKLPKKELLYTFLREGGFTPLISQLLINKGFTEVKAAYTFLFPQINDFSDPFEIPEMTLAVKRVAEALKTKEVIGIYGDSDADGIIGTYLLYDFLKEVSEKEPVVLIPDKNKEGYGFHGKFLPYFKEKGVSLLITVDVGISAYETVEEAKALGLSVIITDHHEVIKKPETIVISGKLTPPDSPFYHLCGAGVVFTFLRALRSYLYESGFFNETSPPSLRKYLELLCLATLADMVPLLGENRIITYFGFRDLNSPSHPALSYLFQELNLSTPLSEEDLHFKIIPRINACGRMGMPEIFFDFLRKKTYEEIHPYICKINNFLSERQSLEAELWENIEKNLKNEFSSPVLIGIFENLPKGLLGLLANRAKNKFGKPALIISFENGIGFGSGRSTDDLDLLDILLKEKHLFLELGGHQKAFGFQILKENIPYLQQILTEKLKNLERRQAFGYVDGETRISELLLEENLLALKELPPYGIAHEPPLFFVKDFTIKDVIYIKEKHTKFLLRDGKDEIYALYFNQKIDLSPRFIIGTPFINHFTQRLEIRIEDVKT